MTHAPKTIKELIADGTRDRAIATAPVFMRARLQLARLQDVIDYGIGDVERAARIHERISLQLEASVENEWNVARHGNLTMLDLVLSDWKFAIDSTCAEVERSMSGETA